MNCRDFTFDKEFETFKNRISFRTIINQIYYLRYQSNMLILTFLFAVDVGLLATNFNINDCIFRVECF